MPDPVQAGVALLDEHMPDWRSKIVVDTLDMESCEQCILGQLYGDIGIGAVALDIQYGNTLRDSGFNLDGARYRTFDILRDAWVREIQRGPYPQSN